MKLPFIHYCWYKNNPSFAFTIAKFTKQTKNRKLYNSELCLFWQAALWQHWIYRPGFSTMLLSCIFSQKKFYSKQIIYYTAWRYTVDAFNICNTIYYLRYPIGTFYYFLCNNLYCKSRIISLLPTKILKIITKTFFGAQIIRILQNISLFLYYNFCWKSWIIPVSVFKF